jgi:hypothetical protein
MLPLRNLFRAVGVGVKSQSLSLGEEHFSPASLLRPGLSMYPGRRSICPLSTLPPRRSLEISVARLAPRHGVSRSELHTEHELNLAW